MQIIESIWGFQLIAAQMRTKALGYILTDDNMAVVPTNMKSEGKSNKLHIQIHRCQGLKSAAGVVEFEFESVSN